MHIQHGIPLLVVNFLNHIIPSVPGIVDNDVQVIKRIHRCFHKPHTKIFCRDTAGTDHRFGAHPLNVTDQLFKRFGIQIIDHQSSTFTGQLQCYFTTYAATGTGHQRHFSRQLFHRRTSTSTLIK